VLLTILITGDTHSRLTAITRYLIGFGTIFLFYILFNLTIGGTPMPNTFYAKQAEYASWQTLPILTRLGQMSLQLLVGPVLSWSWGCRLAGHLRQKSGGACRDLWCVGI
jgi:hypothetical protein